MQPDYSTKHHYLPVFFQNGFCNENNMIHVYDKKDDIFLEESTPKNYFFKKNLNNFRFKGEIISSSEKSVYTPMDTKISRTFKKIIENNTQTDITTPEEKIDFLLFMSHLFWRSPSSDDIFKTIIQKEGACNKYFGLYNEGTGERMNDEDFPEYKEKMLSNYEFLKMFKILIPLSVSNKEEIFNLVMNWKLFILESHTRFYFLTGDSPLLYQNDEIKLGKVFNKIIFPFSRNQVLVLNKNIPKFIDDYVVRSINMSIIHTSNRFVASGDRQNLEYFVNFYKEFRNQGKDKEILENTFGLIDYISKFGSFEHYKYNIEKQIGDNK